MSFREKGRKVRPVFGKTFPQSSGKVEELDADTFSTVIANTLQEAFGGTRMSVKTVMAHTGAGERAVKNWFEGKNAPNGANLVNLMRHSDEVLEALLVMSGREDILAGKLLVDARDKLTEMLEIIDQLHAENLLLGEPPIRT
jgi:hypothetical protein